MTQEKLTEERDVSPERSSLTRELYDPNIAHRRERCVIQEKLTG